MRVLLDMNAILDAMLQRPPWHKEADAILQAAALGQVTCASTTYPWQRSSTFAGGTAALRLRFPVQARPPARR